MTALPVSIALAAALTLSTANSVTHNGTQELTHRAVHPQVTAVVAPAVERRAILLSGRVENPEKEMWESILYPPTNGNAAPIDAELWVRNVSRPTLEPFLPDPRHATGAGMIIVPGGSFVSLAMDREGYPVAKWLNERGIAAFVLKYRTVPAPSDQKEFQKFGKQLTQPMEVLIRAGKRPPQLTPLMSQPQRDAMGMAQEDALDAIRYVRTHAAQYGLSANRIGMMGFSAGAITVLNVALRADAASRPDLIAPIYGVLPDDAPVPAGAPPAFIAAATDDWLSAYSLDIYNAWRAKGISAEVHIFENGGHGFGMLRQGKGSDLWPTLFDQWLRAHGFESSAAGDTAK